MIWLLHKVVTDGTSLYFNDLNKSGPNIAQVSTRGGEVSYLSVSAVRDPLLVGGSLDGTELLFFDSLAENPGLWVSQLPNGPQRKIDIPSVTFASLAPDGK